jgi:urea carboxylase-associated protein 2
MSPGSETATAAGALAHARAQAGAIVDAMPVLPASSYPRVPAGVDEDDMTWAETVAGGGYTSKVLSRGTTIRLTDLRGDACAHVLLYNAQQPWERLNVADTVKVPWQAYLGAGHPLLSDQGRVLATIVTDTAGSHDALCGCSSAPACARRYGSGLASGPTPAGRPLFVLAAAKHGLGPRDVPPSVSFFKGVHVEEDGGLRFLGAAGGAGAYVELRAELPLIALIVNTPHPLDPRPGYECSTLEVLAWKGEATRPGETLWSSTPELERAFLATADYVLARGDG